MHPAPPQRSLACRQFLYGSSSGIMIGAVAGFFWLCLSAWSADCARAGLPPWTTESVRIHYLLWVFWVALAGAGVLIAGALGVRRKSQGFSFREVRQASEAHRQRTRWITRNYILVVLAEAAGCAVSALLGMHFHRWDLIWPAVSLVVALHFLALAKVFGNPVYTVTGIAGSIVSLPLLLVPAAALQPSVRISLLGLAMCPVMWGTAAYGIANAERLAERWANGVAR